MKNFGGDDFFPLNRCSSLLGRCCIDMVLSGIPGKFDRNHLVSPVLLVCLSDLDVVLFDI